MSINDKMKDLGNGYFEVEGTSETDLEDVLGGTVIISELPKGKYVMDVTETIGLNHDPNRVPEVYRVSSQGDGYANNVTKLRIIGNPKRARALAFQLKEDLERGYQ